MKRSTILALPLVALLLLPGRAGAQTDAPATAPQSAAEVPQTAVCAICGVREKSGLEPVAATYVHQGKTYFFCRQACKEEFRLDPEKWIKAAADPRVAQQLAKPRPGAAAVPT